VPAMIHAMPVPMKQPHQEPPSIVVAAFVPPESTKPMVLIRDPVATFVRRDLLLPPSPPVAPLVLDQCTKHKMTWPPFRVPLTPFVSRASIKRRHLLLPRTVSVPLAAPDNIKIPKDILAVTIAQQDITKVVTLLLPAPTHTPCVHPASITTADSLLSRTVSVPIA
jgi:hypothetical protein